MEFSRLCVIENQKGCCKNKHSQVKLCTTLSGSDPTTSSKRLVRIPDSKILNDFKELFLQQKDCDIIIRVKGKEFLAHRLILKARSPVFASAFHNVMKEKSKYVVDIEDCDPGTFSNFLHFLYSGDVENLSVENVFSLFKTSVNYDVHDLRRKCLAFIKKSLSVDTFCDTISLAVLHSETKLVKLSANFFAKNLQDIIVTVKWQLFLAENYTIANELLIKALVPNKCSK